MVLWKLYVVLYGLTGERMTTAAPEIILIRTFYKQLMCEWQFHNDYWTRVICEDVTTF